MFVLPCFNVTLLYPVFALDVAYIGVPDNITVVLVNAVPPLLVLVSYFVVNEQLLVLLLTLYETIVAGVHVFPAASFAHTYHVFAVLTSFVPLVSVPVVVQLVGAVLLFVIAYPVTPTVSLVVQLNVL